MIFPHSLQIQTVNVVTEAFPNPRSVSSLDVLLNDLKVGTIVRTPGDFNAFSFEDSYRATGGLPVLSLSFRAVGGGLRKDPKPVARALPSFFANLLPEDKLREAMEKYHAGSVRAGNDFDLLVALGADLPGAVRVVPGDGAFARQENISAPKPKARFSLAGVQMKLSGIKNTGKGGG
ncbi:HipA N-terminal domain-containing protein [Rhizobium sp. NFR07]|nr:HipA N-terminal domain-containing protein [Rhizobium sp. NFR07]